MVSSYSYINSLSLAHFLLIVNLNVNSVISTTVGRYIKTQVSRLLYSSQVYIWEQDRESKVVLENCRDVLILVYVLFFLIIAMVLEAHLTSRTSLLCFV